MHHPTAPHVAKHYYVSTSMGTIRARPFGIEGIVPQDVAPARLPRAAASPHPVDRVRAGVAHMAKTSCTSVGREADSWSR
jgi:hypothetical protein